MKTVLIIGSGIAGLTCAIRSAESGSRVILAAPYISERAQSVMAAGGINAALKHVDKDDSTALHIEDTWRGGAELEPMENVRALCENAPQMVHWLESLGVVFSRNSEGKIDQRAFGGQSRKRTCYAGTAAGRQIVSALVMEARKYECSARKGGGAGMIERRLRIWFHSALIRGGVCHGAIFYNEETQDLETITADEVVMATGGQNAVFGKTTGSQLCDGYGAAKLFQQGVILRNLEFIQYHPTTIVTAQKKMLISEAARGDGGRLFYLDGGCRVYFMEELYGERGNLMPRDIVSKCIYDCPSQVYLDISFLGEETIDRRLTEIRELCQDYLGLDVTREPIPVEPSVHFFMGGIAVDMKHRTNIEHLYAVGECASMYHGANRLGGNSLLAAVYSGSAAARAISGSESAAHPDFSADLAEARAELSGREGTPCPVPAVQIYEEMTGIMNSNLGITRTENKLKDGIERIRECRGLCSGRVLDESVTPYQRYALPSLLTLCEAVLTAALQRRETRGAQIREDYPETKPELALPTYAALEQGTIHTWITEKESKNEITC